MMWVYAFERVVQPRWDYRARLRASILAGHSTATCSRITRFQLVSWRWSTRFHLIANFLHDSSNRFNLLLLLRISCFLGGKSDRGPKLRKDTDRRSRSSGV